MPNSQNNYFNAGIPPVYPKGKSSALRIFLMVAFIFLAGALKAQGDMRFFGTATKGGAPLPGATVVVLMDGKQIYNLTTGKNGKFKFTIDINHNYRINFSAPGCVDMYLTMDLHTPPDKAWVYPDYVGEIPFFTSGDPKVKTELFAQKPFIKIIFDGNKGFYDDPTYKFVEEIFKNPAEEQQRKRDELAKKEAEEKVRLAAEDKVRREEAERQRLAKEDEDRRKAEEDKRKNVPVTGNKNPVTNEPPTPTDPSMETDAIRLEREKQDKLEREKQNKNIRATYENNLLKLVAESERRNNLQKYNKMKESAEGNSVVQTLRKEAQVKAENDFLIEKMKERQKQTLAHKRIKEERIKQLVETAAKIERDDRATSMKPVAASQDLNYAPSPNVVVTTEQNFLTETKTTVISWPGGIRTIFNVDEYLWGSRYYYHDGVEIDQKTYDAELFRHKRN
ncbi:MAG: hypothetical protein M3R17_19910 [Bacteroidota bacterium]|nr:hypothetical protein [Bacteroidota bacterium]